MRFGMPLWAAAAAVVLAPVAHADALDDQFVNSLAAQGIWGDRQQLINDGQATCDNYGTPGMNGVLFQIMGLGLTNVQASRVMIVGLRAYCPEKAAAGTMAAMLGPGSAAAPADPNPTEDQLAQLSRQSAPATCKTLSYVSDADGVRGAIDGVMGKTGLSQPEAERVVARSIADSCPQYQPLVKQAAPTAP
jgi:Protein of unknown function (DUF732)